MASSSEDLSPNRLWCGSKHKFTFSMVTAVPCRTKTGDGPLYKMCAFFLGVARI